MLCFGPVNVVYKNTNQSSKYINGSFHLKIPNVPDDFFLSIDPSRTVHSVQSSSTLLMEAPDAGFIFLRKTGHGSEINTRIRNSDFFQYV